MNEYLFPFLDKYPLQAKKRKSYEIFTRIVLMVLRKEYLRDEGFERITKLRDELRALGKKAKTFRKTESSLDRTAV